MAGGKEGRRGRPSEPRAGGGRNLGFRNTVINAVGVDILISLGEQSRLWFPSRLSSTAESPHVPRRPTARPHTGGTRIHHCRGQDATSAAHITSLKAILVLRIVAYVSVCVRAPGQREPAQGPRHSHGHVSGGAAGVSPWLRCMTVSALKF